MYYGSLWFTHKNLHHSDGCNADMGLTFYLLFKMIIEIAVPNSHWPLPFSISNSEYSKFWCEWWMFVICACFNPFFCVYTIQIYEWCRWNWNEWIDWNISTWYSIPLNDEYDLDDESERRWSHKCGYGEHCEQWTLIK